MTATSPPRRDPDVSVREHRDGTSENRANGSFPQRGLQDAAGRARGQGGLVKAASEPYAARLTIVADQSEGETL
jgi:hypothetical protein